MVFFVRGGIDLRVLEGDLDALPRQHFCPCRQRHLFCRLLEAFSLSSVGVVMFVGVADGGVIFELAGKVRVESSVVGGADVTSTSRGERIKLLAFPPNNNIHVKPTRGEREPTICRIKYASMNTGA